MMDRKTRSSQTRRDFLKGAAVFGMATACGGIISGCSTSSEDESRVEVKPQSYIAGTYTTTENGMLGEISVEVGFLDSKIESIKVNSHKESPRIGEKALELLSEKIIEQQSLGVDAISGATVTSMALLAAVAGCAEQAGGDVSALKAAPVEVPEAKDETIEVDVVVVGSGIAGLTSAVAAQKEGVSVALVEKEDIVGGTSVMAEGYFFSTNTSDAEGLYQTFLKRASETYSNEFPEDIMIRTLADNNDAALEMVRSTGVKILPLREFTDIAATAEGIADPQARSAYLLIDALSESLRTNGGTIYTGTPANQITTDSSGAVTGLICSSDSGTKTFVTKSVILASGDYARNEEMMQELIPQSANCYTITAIGNVGDGVTLGREVGAQAYPDQYVQGGPLIFDPTDVYRGSYSSPAFSKKSLIVSLGGDRRVAEDQGTRPIHYSYTNFDQPDGAWCIMDARVAAEVEGVEDLVSQTTADSTVQAYKADTIFDLALAASINPEVFMRNFDRYNNWCEQGNDGDFGKSAEFLTPLATPPFYAVRGYAICRGSLGGLVINKNGQVLDERNSPIEGLYAVGTLASRAFFSRTYHGGSALGIGATMGYVSGRHAAQRV